MEQDGPTAQELVFLPPLSLSKIIGRQNALRAIDKDLGALDTSAATQPTTVILGMGGQGKTQLALEYCWRSLKSRTSQAVF